MHIRYYTARNLTVVGAVAAAITSSLSGADSSATNSERRAPVAPKKPQSVAAQRPSTPTPQPRAASAAVPKTVGTKTARRGQRAWASIFVETEKPARAPKAKDVFRGTGPKLNLYDDNGDARYDRGKVDWNRDGNWDSKLTLKNGIWEVTEGQEVRQWDSGAKRLSTKRSAQASTAKPSPAPTKAGVKLPAVYGKVGTTIRDGRARGKKAKDAMRATGAKVNLYDDDQDGKWDRAKVDVQRDGSWDGKLTRKGGAIELKLGGVVYWLDGDAWRPKQK